MPRFHKVKETENGWSDRQSPRMNGYRLGCCDCGLVHEMDFKAIRVTSRNPNGTWDYEELDPAEYLILFRARRNNRSTAALRRGDAKRTQAEAVKKLS